MEGANGAPPAGGRGCRRLPRFGSDGIDQVKLAVEKLFEGMVAQNLTGQAVDAVGEKADFVGGVVGNTLALGDKSPQHAVMTFVGTFLTGRIWMGEVHLYLAVLQ